MISFRFQSFETACLSVVISLSELRGTIMTNGDGISSQTGPLSMAFVSPGWPPDAFANGIIPYIANIADEMRAAGHKVTIVSQRVEGIEDSDDLRNADWTRQPRSLATKAIDLVTRRLSPSTANHRRSVKSLASACRRLIAERGLQIVEIEESFGISRPLQEALPIPIVVRFHGPWFLNGPLQGAVEDDAFRLRVRMEREAIVNARAITSSSLDVLERTRAYYGLPIEHARVIRPPTTMIAPEDRWTAEGAEPGSIVFVGRFDRHKGGDLVIDAFAEVARRDPGATLTFIGPDAGYRDESGRSWTIQDYIADRVGDGEIAGRIRWLGRQPSAALPALRRKGAVVVIGSRYDNFPVTVIEAMALGTPLVAPRIGGIPEIVTDGVNGLFYEVENFGDMAAKLLQILRDRELASRLGRQAAIDCKLRHDPAVTAREIADFYREVVGAPGRSPERVLR